MKTTINIQGMIMLAGLVLVVAFGHPVPIGAASADHGGEYVTLKKDLVLPDAKGGRDVFFADISSLRVDDLGTIYILDKKDKKVKVFDAAGALTCSFGTKGQGPGEFQVPLDLFLIHGEIRVFDFGNKRLSSYRPDGSHIADLDLRKLPSMFRPDAADDSVLYGNMMGESADGVRCELVSVDVKTGKTVLISEQKDRYSYPRVNPLSARYIMRIKSDGKLVWTDPRDYSIYTCGVDGRTISTVRHEDEKIKVTDAYKKDIIKRVFGGDTHGAELVWPEYLAPITSLTLDDADRLYVETCLKDSEGRTKYDVFDASGTFLGSFHLGARIMAVKAGLVYAVAENAEGEPVVERYRMLKER